MVTVGGGGQRGAQDRREQSWRWGVGGAPAFASSCLCPWHVIQNRCGFVLPLGSNPEEVQGMTPQDVGQGSRVPSPPAFGCRSGRTLCGRYLGIGCAGCLLNAGPGGWGPGSEQRVGHPGLSCLLLCVLARWHFPRCSRQMPPCRVQDKTCNPAASSPSGPSQTRQDTLAPEQSAVQMLIIKCHNKYFLVFQSSSEVPEAELWKLE